MGIDVNFLMILFLFMFSIYHLYKRREAPAMIAPNVNPLMVALIDTAPEVGLVFWLAVSFVDFELPAGVTESDEAAGELEAAGLLEAVDTFEAAWEGAATEEAETITEEGFTTLEALKTILVALLEVVLAEGDEAGSGV